MTEQNQELQAHPFQRTLGPGPYRLIGYFTLVLPSEANQGRNNFHLAPQVERGMGSCAHCGTAIINVCIISIGDGRRFGVGSDCVRKVGLPAKELTKLERIERERQKVLRANRKAKKGQSARDELKQLIESHNEKMLSLPHISPVWASQGKTLKDYAEWIVLRSNDGGIVIALKRIKTLLGVS